jgi:hypothetical protein
VRGAVLVLAVVACKQSDPPRPHVAPRPPPPPPPSLATKLAAFNERLAAAICDTLCRCDRFAGCDPKCKTNAVDPPDDDQLLAQHGCHYDETAAERCLDAANADCKVLQDFGEWHLYVEGECAKVVSCTPP